MNFLRDLLTRDKMDHFVNTEMKEHNLQTSPENSNTFEQKNGYSVLGPQENFVGRIHRTKDHNNFRGLL